MPRKSGLAYPLPFLDPKLNPDHPINHLPPLPEDPYLPYGKRERARLLNQQLESALASYVPPHVVRSFETDKYRADQYSAIMDLRLGPKFPSGGPVDKPSLHSLKDRYPNDQHLRESITSLIKASPYDSHAEFERTDFRQFAVVRLHLGYHRFHLSTDPEGDEIGDLPSIHPDEVCWIMEYTETECSTIRRQIAHALGLYPAVADEESSAYDEEIAYRYDRRLKARCRRRNTRCIRPAHIELFTQCGRLLP